MAELDELDVIDRMRCIIIEQVITSTLDAIRAAIDPSKDDFTLIDGP